MNVDITEDTREEDEGVPDDERTMKFLQTVANSIHPSIRMTIDYPTKYAEGKVPMLDVKMWITKIRDKWKVLYEHYEEWLQGMATKAVIHATSAIPFKMKRTVLTQEMLQILLHCSRSMTWEGVLQHLNNFMRKMQYSVWV